MRIAIAGASGFLGRALIEALVSRHDDVIGLSRQRLDLPGVEGHAVDVADERTLRKVLTGCESGFYLVHSLGDRNFRAHDRRLAEGFGRAAAAAGVQRIVYLGGLGQDPKSEHLASRQEVGTALGAGGVPVVELRAAVVLGAGSISFEMLRYLTERLPFMICPRWVHTRIQPIAVADIIKYLISALNVDPGVYEVGGSEVTTYREMIAAYATVRGLHRRPILDVPYLTPRLSSYWLDLVTPVDRRVSHTLVESLVADVVVGDRSRTEEAFGIEPIGLLDALSAALDDQARTLDTEVLDREHGLRDGVYTMSVAVLTPPGTSASAEADFDGIGGSYDWYGLPTLWRVRAALGRLVGERLRVPSDPRSFSERRSTGGSSHAETPARWYYAAKSGSPGRDGSPIGNTTTSSSRSARSVRKGCPASSIGSSCDQSIVSSSGRWRVIGQRWRGALDVPYPTSRMPSEWPTPWRRREILPDRCVAFWAKASPIFARSSEPHPTDLSLHLTEDPSLGSSGTATVTSAMSSWGCPD